MLGGSLLSAVAAGLPGPPAPRAIALRGRRLVVAGEDGEATVAELDGDRSRAAGRLELPSGPGPLALSASGRFLLARSPACDRAVVHDLETGADVVDVLGTPDVAGSAVAGLAAAGDRELLLISTAAGELRGYELPGGASVLHAHAPPFVFEHLVAVGGGDLVIALGHYPTEGRDSLLLFPLAELLADPRAARRVVAERPGIDDYAYALAAGPCGPDAVVVYRNPEDGEEIDADEEPEDVPPDRPDVFGFHGFYVRRLADRRLLGRVPPVAAMPTGTELFATRAAVVIGHPDRIEVVDRERPAAAPVELTGPARGLDPDGRRVAVVGPGGGVEVHRVAG